MRKKIVLWALLLIMGIIGSQIVYAKEPGTEPEIKQDIYEEQREQSTEDVLGGQPSAVPSDDDLKSWEADGSLEARIKFMKSLGMQNMNGTIGNVQKNARNVDGFPANWEKGMPSKGDVKTLVFLIEFQDVKNQDDTITADSVKDILFETGTGIYPYETVSNYYRRSSFNQLNIDGEVYGWLTLAHERSYYEGNEGREEMLREILETYDPEIDFSQYDADHNGYLDGLYIHFAGDNQGWGSDWWSYVADTTSEISSDGIKLQKYAMLHEAWPTTVIHETGHLLGLPDYYDYDGTFNQSGEAGGLGYFDMMDSNAGDHNIFSKLLLGWVEPEFIQSDTVIDMKVVTSGEAKAYIIDSEGKGEIFSEYYILEYYKPEENNSFGPSSDGSVRIYHVDASLGEAGGFVNDNTATEHKLIKLIESDGKEENGLKGYPIYTTKYYAEGMELGVNGYPSSEFYQGRYSGINIKVEEIETTSAAVRIYFTTEENEVPSLSGEIKQNMILNQISQIKDARIYFDTAIYASDNLDAVYAEDMEGNQVAVRAEILNPRLQYQDSRDRYNILVLNSEPLRDNCQYTLIVPAGAVCDSFGNKNEVIAYPFYTAKTVEGMTSTDMMDSIPNEIPDDCSIIMSALSRQIKNGNILYCRKFTDENYDKMYTFVQEVTLENERINEQVVPMPSGLEENQKYYYNQVIDIIQLDNEEILLLFQDGYYRFRSGEDIGTKNSYPDNVFIGGGGSNYILPEYDDCYINIRNSDFKNGIWYTDYIKIFKDGRMENGRAELEYSWNYFYYDKDFHLKSEAKKLFDSNQDVLFAKENYEDVFGYNEYGIPFGRYDRHIVQEGSMFISNYLSTFSSNWTTADVYAIKMEQLDDIHNKVMDIRLSQGGILGARLFELPGDQGYVAYVPFASKFTDVEAQVVRLDMEFNIRWNAYVQTHEIITGAYLKNGAVKLLAADKWVSIPDNEEIQISAEEMYSFAENKHVKEVDRTNKIIKINTPMSAGALKDLIEGDYQKVTVYDAVYREVLNNDKPIDSGLMKITASNGIYEYYYQIVKEEIENPDISNPHTTRYMQEEEVQSILGMIATSSEAARIDGYMEEATILPLEILQAMQGKNIELILHMDGGIAWTINGKSVAAEGLKDTNLLIRRTEKDKGPIPVSAIDIIAGELAAEQLDPEHGGDFEFDAKLTVDVDVSKEGSKGVLLWYDGEALQLADSALVSSGKISLDFNHASQYALIYSMNGDVDRDSKVTIRDLMRILHHVSGYQAIDGFQQGVADVDINNKVNIQDLMRTLHFISGKNSEL